MPRDHISESQLHTLQHALGVDQYGRGTMYRNYYVGGEKECRPLVELGFMTEHKPSDLTGGDPWFHVTDAGKQVVRDESPAPPKLTRSQQRYRQFVKMDSGLKFGEWLKAMTEQKGGDVSRG